MLQCVVICCNMLGYVMNIDYEDTMCCNMLQHVRICHNIEYEDTMCCTMLQHVVICHKYMLLGNVFSLVLIN